jgi:hypothetical protein
VSGDRELLAALLIELWEEDAGESLDGIDGVSESIDAYLARLLPVVDRIARARAAAELRAAADTWHDHFTDGGGPVTRYLNARANALDPS